LIFAQYGKFQQLGAALAIGAVFLMLATLTLLPAILVLLGRWAFWPRLRTERISADQSWGLPRATWSRLMGHGWSAGLWRFIHRTVQEKPRFVLLACLLLMAPFIAAAVMCHEKLTYGLLSQLPEDEPSVKGAEIIQQQFPAGTTGPVTMLIEHPELEFHTVEGKRVIGEISDAIERRKEHFGIADIRSVSFPLGLAQKDVGSQNFFQRTLRHRKAVEYYVGDTPAVESRATKLEIVFAADPFSRRSIAQFENLRQTLPELLPAELDEAKWHLLGGPANIRDLKFVTDRDRLLIQVLVIAAVFLCLWGLSRQAVLSAELVGLGVLNFLAALGATFAAFWFWSPDVFEGLNWKVPGLLFVVLMSLSAQSHWLLLARIREEQQDHGPAEGLPIALERSGTVFLGAGLIAAGVFASLLGGSLVVLKQFGFGLASGLLIDALLIRPFLIPTCLLLSSQGRAKDEPARTSAKVTTSASAGGKNPNDQIPMTKGGGR
jgi:putative drug exporter of the RND superfamily